MSSQTVLVTGGAGFIGGALAHRLVNTCDVIVVDNLSQGTQANVPPEATFVHGDLSNPGTYEALDDCDEIDIVLHLAGQSSGEASFDKPMVDLKSHAVSTLRLLRWCNSNNIERLLYASSMSVYGEPQYLPVDEKHPVDPQTYYAAGKLSAESYVKLFNNLGMDNTIFRLFTVYGPGQNLDNMKQGMVSIYLSFVLDDEELLVKGPLDRFRDLVFVDDVVDVWVDAIDNPETYGETYNIASGEKTTVEQLIDCILDCYGVTEYPIEVTDGTLGDQFGIYGDVTKLKEDFDRLPSTSLETGLTRMIEFYENE